MVLWIVQRFLSLTVCMLFKFIFIFCRQRYINIIFNNLCKQICWLWAHKLFTIKSDRYFASQIAVRCVLNIKKWSSFREIGLPAFASFIEMNGLCLMRRFHGNTTSWIGKKSIKIRPSLVKSLTVALSINWNSLSLSGNPGGLWPKTVVLNLLGKLHFLFY